MRKLVKILLSTSYFRRKGAHENSLAEPESTSTTAHLTRRCVPWRVPVLRCCPQICELDKTDQELEVIMRSSPTGLSAETLTP